MVLGVLVRHFASLYKSSLNITLISGR